MPLSKFGNGLSIFNIVSSVGAFTDLTDKVKVDAAATADYIGAGEADGVLRVTAPISLADGGNFVTLSLDTDGVNDTHIDWGAGANQVDADDVPESATKKWAGETGADVTASHAPQAHKDSHDPNDGGDALDTAAAAEVSAVVAAGVGTSHSLARADHVHAINHGITDNHIVTVDQADAADNDIAKFTASGIEGRSYSELRGDLDLEAGTDFPSLTTFNDHSARHESGGADAIKLDDLATPDANTDLNANTTNHGLLLQATAPAAGLYNYVGITNGETAYTNKALFDATAVTDSDTVNAGAVGTATVAARRDHTHKIDHSIADNAVVTVDDASAADNDIAVFTANGIEGQTTSAVLTSLLANVLVENDEIKLDDDLSQDEKWNGITRTGTAGATLAIGDVCYYAVGDGRWELADADQASTSQGMLGICVQTAANDGSATTMLLIGMIRSAAFPAFTAGAPVFLSTTDGDITSTAPSGSSDIVRVVGQAWTADELWFCPSPDWIELAA